MTDEIWKEQCRQRMAWINEANLAWRKAIATQQEIKYEQAELVRIARVELMYRKAYPAPPRPVKQEVATAPLST